MEELLQKITAKDKAIENLNQQIDQLEEDMRAAESKGKGGAGEEMEKEKVEMEKMEKEKERVEKEKERVEKEKAALVQENEALKKDKEKLQAEITLLQENVRIQGETLSNTIKLRASSFSTLNKPVAPPAIPAHSPSRLPPPIPARSASPSRLPPPITHTVPPRPPTGAPSYAQQRSQSPVSQMSRSVASVTGLRVQRPGSPLSQPSALYQQPVSPVQRPVSPVQRPATPVNSLPATALPQISPS